MSIKDLNWNLFFKRAVAYIIDQIIVFLATQIILAISSLFFVLQDDAMLYFLVLLWIVYYVYMLGKYGYTFGKKIYGFKVVNSDDTPITYKTAFLRFLATTLSALILFIGFFMVLFNKKGLALHDKILGTMVVDNKKI